MRASQKKYSPNVLNRARKKVAQVFFNVLQT